MPIVYRGVMYFFAPGASIQAVDATNGDLIWEYVRDYPANVRAAAGRNKNIGIYEDMIYLAAPDGFLLVADTFNNRLRKFDPKTGTLAALAGMISTLTAK